MEAASIIGTDERLPVTAVYTRRSTLPVQLQNKHLPEKQSSSAARRAA